MPPVKILNLLCVEPVQLSVDVLLISPLVVRLHPEQQENRTDEDQAGRSQVNALLTVSRCLYARRGVGDSHFQWDILVHRKA